MKNWILLFLILIMNSSIAQEYNEKNCPIFTPGIGSQELRINETQFKSAKKVLGDDYSHDYDASWRCGRYNCYLMHGYSVEYLSQGIKLKYEPKKFQKNTKKVNGILKSIELSAPFCGILDEGIEIGQPNVKKILSEYGTPESIRNHQEKQEIELIFWKQGVSFIISASVQAEKYILESIPPSVIESGTMKRIKIFEKR